MSVHSDMELLLLTTATDKALLAAAVRVQKALTRAHSLLEEIAESGGTGGCLDEWAPHSAARLLSEWGVA